MRHSMPVFLATALLFFCPVPTRAADTVSLLDHHNEGPNIKVEKTSEGLTIASTDSKPAWFTSQSNFKTPLVITARVKTDSNEIRLVYAKGELILGWAAHPDTLRFREPRNADVTEIARAGSIPANTWITVQWIVDEKTSVVTIDGKKRASIDGDFSGMTGKAAIGTTGKAVLTVKSLDVTSKTNPDTKTPPVSPDKKSSSVNIARNTPASIDVDVPSQKIIATNKVPPATFDPLKIERPEFHSTPKSFERSLTSITALVVLTSGDDEITGKTADIIATVPSQTRQSDKAGAGFFRSDGDDMMKTAFEEAVRAVTLRYPIWEPGHIDVSFGEKFIGHAGPSAGTAFALLMLSCLEGFEPDTQCAVTGDISVDWKVRIVGGVGMKLRGAFLDKCLYACIPQANELAFTDMGVYYGHHAWWDLQVFSAATLQDAQSVVRKDRPEKLAEAIKLFAALQPQLNKAERTTLQDRNTIDTLKKILELAPNHLSARQCYALATGTAPRTLSLAASTSHLGIAWSPFRDWLSNKGAERTSFKTIAALTRKRLDTLRPIIDKTLLPLLTEESAFVESLDSYAEGRVNLSSVQTRYESLTARAATTFSDPALLEKIVREGY